MLLPAGRPVHRRSLALPSVLLQARGSGLQPMSQEESLQMGGWRRRKDSDARQDCNWFLTILVVLLLTVTRSISVIVVVSLTFRTSLNVDGVKNSSILLRSKCCSTICMVDGGVNKSTAWI